MPVHLHVQRQRQFKPDLYKSADRTAWLEAVGKQLESKAVTLKIGEGAGAFEVKIGADLGGLGGQGNGPARLIVACAIGLLRGRGCLLTLGQIPTLETDHGPITLVPEFGVLFLDPLEPGTRG